MSITDANLTLSSAQAVTATAFSTNTIDLGVARDIGAGEELEIYVEVDTTAAAAGAATVNFQIVASDNANLSSPNIIGQTDAIGKAALVQGARFIIPVPNSYNGKPIGQRYIGLQYTVGTGPLTAGAFSAGVVMTAGDNAGAGAQKIYPSGFAVK